MHGLSVTFPFVRWSACPIQVVSSKAGPACLGVYESFRVHAQPVQHVKEVFGFLLVPFFHWLVSEVPDFVQVGGLCESLRFTRHRYSCYAFFAVFLLELRHCFVEYVASADLNRFLVLDLQPVQQSQDGVRSLSEVLFGPEARVAEVLHIKNVIGEFLRFVTIGTYDYAKQQVASSGVIDYYGQLAASPCPAFDSRYGSSDIAYSTRKIIIDHSNAHVFSVI